MDNQDKLAWCQRALADEEAFVVRLKSAGIPAGINPEKRTDIYAPDLVVEGRIGDYKHERTPFFTASRYDISADNAYSFNVKDFTRYREKYPDLDIWVHLEWEAQEAHDTTVVASDRVYCVPLQFLVDLVESRPICHTYLQRKNDKKGNARQSFIVDATAFEPYRRRV